MHATTSLFSSRSGTTAGVKVCKLLLANIDVIATIEFSAWPPVDPQLPGQDSFRLYVMPWLPLIVHRLLKDYYTCSSLQGNQYDVG